MVGQSGAHLHLIFVPLPPLIMLAVVELFVRRSGNPRRWGLVLGLAVAGQFLISSEVLFTSGLVAVLSLIILGVGNPAQVGPSLRFAGAGLALAAVVVESRWPIRWQSSLPGASTTQPLQGPPPPWGCGPISWVRSFPPHSSAWLPLP